MINLNLTSATRVGLNLLALLGAIVALRLGESVFIPTVISVLLAAMLWPAVAWLHRRCALPWSVACLAVVGSLVVINLLLTLGFTLAITNIVQDLPDPRTEEGQVQLYRAIRNPLAKMFPESVLVPYFPEPPGAGPIAQAEPPAPVQAPDSAAQIAPDKPTPPRHWQDSGVFKLMKEALNPEKPYIISILWTLVEYGYSWLWQWVLVMFILLFLMIEGRMLSRRIVEIFGPSEPAQTAAVIALADMARRVRSFLIWRTLINIGLGLIVGVVYYALGLRQAWTWALLTALLCYIPYLGTIAAGVPPLLDGLVSCPSPWWVLGILVFYATLTTVEAYILVPVVMGRSMELNATTVMLACLFWELVWGLPGLFLAMPLMAALKAVSMHVPGWRPWANLMSSADDPPTPAVLEAQKVADLLEDTPMRNPAADGAAPAGRGSTLGKPT